MLRKILILCATLLILIGLYAAAGFYLVPKIALDELPKLLNAATGQPVKIQTIRFDPFELTASVEGFSLLQGDESPLFSVAELSVDINVVDSIKRRAIVVQSLILREPYLDIERNAEGRFNFDDLIEKVSQPETDGKQSSETASVPLILVREAALQQGHIDWADMAAGQKRSESLQTIDFTLSDFSSAPDAVFPFSLKLKLQSGGLFDLQGEFDVAALNSKGRLKLDDLALRKTWSLFLQEAMPLEIADGLISLNANYEVNAKDANAVQVLVDSGGLAVRQLELTEKHKDAVLLKIPSFDASGIRLNLLDRRIEIRKVASSDSEIKAWLQADGQMNYVSLFASEADGAEPEPGNADSGRAWQISLDELNVHDSRIAFTDFSQAKPVELAFDQLELAIQGYRNADELSLPIQFKTRLNSVGHISLDGNLGLSPFRADFAVALQGIKLKTFQSYVDPFVNLELTDGDFNTQGNLQVKQADEWLVNYQGDAHIAGLITRDKVKNLDFVKWANLELKQMVLDANKQDFKLGHVVFDHPYVRFTIKKDGSTNVEDVIPAQKSNRSSPQSAGDKNKKTEEQAEPVVSIGKIEFKQGQSDFADYALILPFVVKMNDLDGQVDGFSSNTDNALKLNLQGKVRDLAMVKIVGKYQLQSGDSDISMSFKHLPLPLVTPYMAEFAGYKIEKGQMALDLKYAIKAGQLAAQNKIFIDQLVLGEKVENPKAVSLPLELGVALLKDADGKINLDFPLTGSLEDPQFSVGSLISDVLVNLITKTVSAPFNALSSLFDADEDLSSISFAAGNSDITESEAKKLDHLAEGLKAKPELVLEIKGTAYQTQDWPVMRYDALVDILKKMKSGELRDRGEKIRSEYIELSDAEYKRLLAKFYAEVFPQKIEHSLFGAPRIKDKPDADFYAAAREELEAIMKPEPERLNELAVSRANHIVKYLIERGGIDRSRLYILATELITTDSDTGIIIPLSLNVAS